MKWDVKLLAGGDLFYETVEAPNPQQAEAAAKARNPHARIAGVNGRVHRDRHWNGTWEGKPKEEAVHNVNHEPVTSNNNNTNTGVSDGSMIALGLILGAFWILYILFPFIGLGAGGYGGWRLGKKIEDKGWGLGNKISGTTLTIILAVTGSLGGFGIASAMIDSFNNGETTTEDVYVPEPDQVYVTPLGTEIPLQ